MTPALPDFVDDLSLPIEARRARWDEWMVLYEQGVAVLEASGIDPVEAGYRIPDMPFDGTDV
ncbi:hypothetical protein [Pseudoclavibacter endophyticus]|uniref:Uncharacterized protein n=1 Tax=Pseudoclavibacter endophyticus TaxID=1778590 RepID=A0A6H9WP09_9MICO|nr:hypothetical protein [Pseudoclavibacter endophyticus]KAB1649838.1 hypothetical protein F8O04_06315 [Pseudoclavibacter endophyticus]